MTSTAVYNITGVVEYKVLKDVQGISQFSPDFFMVTDWFITVCACASDCESPTRNNFYSWIVNAVWRGNQLRGKWLLNIVCVDV